MYIYTAVKTKVISCCCCTHLDGFIARAAEEVVLEGAQTPHRPAVTDERALTLEDLLRVVGCQHKARRRATWSKQRSRHKE